MKNILIGVIAVIALCLSGCSDVGRYQLVDDGRKMIDTKTGDVYFLESYSKTPYASSERHYYYEKVTSKKEVDEIRKRDEQN